MRGPFARKALNLREKALKNAMLEEGIKWGSLEWVELVEKFFQGVRLTPTFNPSEHIEISRLKVEKAKILDGADQLKSKIENIENINPADNLKNGTEELLNLTLLKLRPLWQRQGKQPENSQTGTPGNLPSGCLHSLMS